MNSETFRKPQTLGTKEQTHHASVSAASVAFLTLVAWMEASMAKRRATKYESEVETIPKKYPHVKSPPGPFKLIGVKRPSLKHEAPYIATETVQHIAVGDG